MENTKKIKSTAKITSIILALAALLAVMMFAGITSYAATSGDYEYTVLSDSTAEITGYSGNATSITIPSKLDGYTITSIGEDAFSDCSSLTSVIIPNSVTNINQRAFYACSNLESITIPNSVTGIDYYAFSYCSSLTNITLPNSIKRLDDFAFYNCSSLTNVTIPSSVTSIGSEVFRNCTSLTSINVDTGNKNYSSQDGILFNKNKTTLIEYPFGKAGSTYTIPNSVTSIGEGAFSDCSRLTSVTIPNSVTNIDVGAFVNCSGLTSIIIPDSVTSICDVAFSNCTSLTNVTIPRSVTSIGWCAFYYCYDLKDVYYTGSEAQWKKIVIDELNDSLKYATIHYNYVPQLSTPKLSSVSNVVAGVKISWGKVSGAEKYRVFYKTGSGSWTKAGDTTGTSYTWTGAKNNTKYTFTVRCMDKNGNYISSYDSTGKSITFMSAPTVSVSNVVAGVKVSWGKVSGASNYAIFRKTPDGSYKKIGTSTGTSYTDKTAKNNTKYIYAVRCATADGKTYTSSYNAGKSKTFMLAPTVSVSNVVAGVKVSWGKVSGAVNYAIFRKTPNGSYKKIGTSTSTSFVDKTAKSNTKYVYAVRCASKDGKTYTSSYNAGKSITFLSAPTVSVSNVVAGVKVSWGKVSGAANYAIFRKTPNGSYKKIGTATGTSFVDKTAKNNTKYVYAVRCATKDGKTYTSSYNAGKSKTFVSAPTFTVSKTSTGVQVKWSKVTGASNYAIFRKTANGSYKKIGTTTGTSYTDKTAKSGTKYIYTVRCASKDGKSYTSSYNAGKSITR